MDEQIKQPTQQPTPQAADTGSGANAIDYSQYANNVQDFSTEINAMFDAQAKAREAQLKSAYDQNLSTLQQAREGIAGTYNTKMNDLATQYERTRRNNNMRADMNGLNTGTGSQMDLAQQSNYLRSFGTLRTAQAQAERDADRQIADLEVNYKNDVAQALANNDFERANALMKEYQRRDSEIRNEGKYWYEQNRAEQKYQDQLAQQQLENERFERSYNHDLEREGILDAREERNWQHGIEREGIEDAREERNWQHGIEREGIEDAREERNWQHGVEREGIEDARTERAWQNMLEQQDIQKAQQDLQNQRQEKIDAANMSQQELENATAAAKQRAAFGDFSGYAQLYGQDVANAMQQYWMFSNPEYAYSMGAMSPDQFYAATGQYPSGSTGGGGGGYGGYSSGGRGGAGNGGGGGNTGGNGGNLGDEITAPLEKLSTEQQLKIAAGVMSGDISADSNLRDAYYAYHMIESDAKNLVRQSGVDPNSEQGKQLVDAAVALYYKDPNVSLEDIQSLQNNRTANAQANAQQLKTESRTKREDEERLDNEKYIQSQINYGSQNSGKEVKTTSKNANGSTGKNVVRAK